MGTLDTGVFKLRLGVQIVRSAQGDLGSVLISLDQNSQAILVRETTFHEGKLRLDIAAAGAQFEGDLSSDGNQIAGRFTQGAVRPLTLKRVDKIALPARSQDPKPPFNYRSGEVIYESGNVRLAGTLTLPEGKGPFPAVLLISGSGPQDRDGTMVGHKPFWVIADYLTRRGIAVLRVDDRGTGQSTGTSTSQNFASMVDDVLAGVDYLKTRAEIDKMHIGLIGHSEGGTVGPMAAVRSKDVAFVVMLAGTGVSGQELLATQADVVARSAGANEGAIALNKAVQDMSVRIVKEESDPKVAVQKMMAEWQKMKAAMPPAEQAMLNAGSVDAALERQFIQANSPELRDIVLTNPAETLRKVKVPVLALNGDRDVQVMSKQNLPAIATALKAGGNDDITTTELPGLNHLFQKCMTCQVGEYGDLEQTFSPDALKIIGDWVLAHSEKL
jgi:hypothetical protein